MDYRSVLSLVILSGCLGRHDPSFEAQLRNIEDKEIAEALRIAREEFDVESGPMFTTTPGRRLTKESVAMETRNSLAQGAFRVLAAQNRFKIEKDAIDEVETALHKILNDGQVGGGQNGVVRDLKIVQFACSQEDITCNPRDPYRSISGICNNLRHPKWGAMSTKFSRFLPPSYADGISIPRGDFVSAFGLQTLPTSSDQECSSNPWSPLPNPRLVSDAMSNSGSTSEPAHTQMLATLGQFLDHDLSLTPELKAARCCANPGQAGCFSIITDDLRPAAQGDEKPECLRSGQADPGLKTPEADPSDDCTLPRVVQSKKSTNCFEFVRSTPFCQESPNHVREQMNAITSYVDGSNIYGSDVDRAQALRTREDGTMKVHDHWALPLLSVDGRQNAYTAGDVRALENPGLTALHTVWHKEHNRIAQELQDLFPFWVDEMLFQEARRLVVAQWQSVIFSQFATQLLGAQRVQNLKLDLTEPSVYDPSVDASIRNSFATAAYRFGHSLVHSLVKVSPMNGTNPREYPLKEHFFTTKLYESGGDEILLGLFHQASQPNDGYLVDDLRNHLFENIFGVQSDLFSRNIQRGRDHGLASYNDHRVFCNLTRPCNWEQKPPEITNADWQMLKLLYSDPDDIDLFVGGLLEEDSQGSILGPTFSCIIGRQFQMLKFGDRFFFTHLNAYPRSFLPHEMTEIRRRSLGDILCDNTNLTRVSENLHLMNSLVLECSSRTKLDLSAFNFFLLS